MRVITLSGWGQPHDALAVLAPDATHIDYARHKNINDALAEIASYKPDMVIGWSLGGQLAVRAMAAGMFSPKKLVLIATPFQFVVFADQAIGMGRDTYTKFRNNYAKNPERTLDKAWELIHKDDVKAEYIRARMEKHDKQSVLKKNWLYWLDALDGYSFKGVDISHLPPALLIHGEQDAVVAHEQSKLFEQAIPGAKSLTLPGAGHAPHWHDAELLKQRIKVHADV